MGTLLAIIRYFDESGDLSVECAVDITTANRRDALIELLAVAELEAARRQQREETQLGLELVEQFEPADPAVFRSYRAPRQ